MVLGTGLSISNWRTLLEAENTALKDSSRTKAKYNDPLIGIRLSGFFLKDFWDHWHAHDGHLGSNPCSCMVTEITSCLKQDNKVIYGALVELGLRYRHKIECQKTGMFLRHPCRISTHLLQALLRDGYKCAISEVYDM